MYCKADISSELNQKPSNSISCNETSLESLSLSQTRIGIAKGEFNINENFDLDNYEIYKSMINDHDDKTVASPMSSKKEPKE